MRLPPNPRRRNGGAVRSSSGMRGRGGIQARGSSRGGRALGRNRRARRLPESNHCTSEFFLHWGAG